MLEKIWWNLIKNQHTFMITTQNKLRIEDNFFNLLKGFYETDKYYT